MKRLKYTKEIITGLLQPKPVLTPEPAPVSKNEPKPKRLKMVKLIPLQDLGKPADKVIKD